MSKIFERDDSSNESDQNETDSAESNIEDEKFVSVRPVSSSNLKNESTNEYHNNKPPKRKSSRINSKKKTNIQHQTSVNSNLSTQSKSVKNSKRSQNTSNIQQKNLEKELKASMKGFFGYDFRNIDLTFIKVLYTQLPTLNEIWDRIGFTKETKENRLDNFYKNLTESIAEIIDNEEVLESKIEDSIEAQHKQIKDICFKLQIKYDDLKAIQTCSTLTMLEEDEQLRQEVNRLEKEVKKRLGEFEQLSQIESNLVEKLTLKKTVLKGYVPSELDITNLKKRIDELEKLYRHRKNEMQTLREEVFSLTEDLNMSTTDSYMEALLFEPIDVITVSERDIERATELRDDLKRKQTDLIDQIRTLRAKIKELWSKLNIENLSIKHLLSCPIEIRSSSDQEVLPKREILLDLNKEHERCVRIKMENMQKFVESIREEINDYCTKMYIGDKEMKKLKTDLLGLTTFTEQLLTQHEEKLEDLKFRFTECESLYEKTAKWLHLWNEFVQFEDKTKDPLRFKQRGYNMLEEEKQRKVFQNQLPKLEEELVELAMEYKNINGGQEYTVYGQTFSDYIHITKLDYEETKLKEKYEKQVLKDHIKKNESRYGSKPITPLAIKNKRKLTGNHQETQLNTPGRKSKLQKTDLMTTNASTPGTSMASVGSRLGSAKPKTILNVKSKVSISKRKSRTPGKNRLMRRSRILANESRAKNQSIMSHDKTTVSKSSDVDQDTTLRTNTLSSTIQSTVSSNSSSLYTSQSVYSKASSSKLTSKCPPLSSSAKYSTSTSTSTTSNACLQRMTSTASNTFIEEEHSSENVNGIVSGAAAKITELVEKAGSQKLYNCEVNYVEFARDLTKPLKFGHDSTNSSQSTTTSQSRQASSKTSSLALKSSIRK